MSKERSSAQSADTTSTRVIGRRELRVDGAPFQWWAVGERPMLVTVRSGVFGSLAEFTDGDPGEVAMTLAKRILTEHYERARKLKHSVPASDASQPAEEPPAAADGGGLRLLD